MRRYSSEKSGLKNGSIFVGVNVIEFRSGSELLTGRDDGGVGQQIAAVNHGDVAHRRRVETPVECGGGRIARHGREGANPPVALRSLTEMAGQRR